MATLVGTTARSENPIPRATDASAPRREGPRSSPRPAAELNEQTQSLYAASEAGTGCELIFLRIETSPPTQLGVVLAHRDNPFGLELNQAICRIRRAIDAGAATAAPLAALNQLLKEKN